MMPMGGAGGAVMSQMLPCPATAVTKAEKPVDEATKSKRSEAAKKAAATRAKNKAAKAEAAKAPEPAPAPTPAPAKKKLAVGSMEGVNIESKVKEEPKVKEIQAPAPAPAPKKIDPEKTKAREAPLEEHTYTYEGIQSNGIKSSVKVLKELAKAMGIEGYSTMKKDRLVYKTYYYLAELGKINTQAKARAYLGDEMYNKF